jgi:hypothetical protein
MPASGGALPAIEPGLYIIASDAAGGSTFSLTLEQAYTMAHFGFFVYMMALRPKATTRFCADRLLQ